MFSFVFGDWYESTEVLVQNVDEWWMIPCIIHQFIIGFAVFTVLQGVFINETFQAADRDNEIMVRRAKHRALQHEKKMRLLFKNADQDNSGYLNFEEFEAVMHEEE